MIPMESYCDKCKRIYLITPNIKTCPNCERAKIERNIFRITIGLMAAVAFIYYLSLL